VHRIFYPLNILLLLAVFSVSGCQQLPEPAVSVGVGKAMSTPTDESNVTWQGLTIQRNNLPTLDEDKQDEDKQTETSLNDDGQTVSEITDAAGAPEPPQDPEPQNLDPAIFIDKSTAHLASTLGEPTMRRNEGAVEIWQYQLADCVVDVYFYDDAGSLIARYTDMRSRLLGGMIDPAACMVNLYEISETAGRTN
jgi:hypothetical protein